MIEEIVLRKLRIPLAAPYKLALGDVTHFDTVLVALAADGRQGYGDATILTGYTVETIEDCWLRACAAAEKLVGLAGDEAKAAVLGGLSDIPFTATGIVTAIEMSEGHPALEIDTPVAVPLLAGINATSDDSIATEIEQAIASGYDTLKIKVGFDLESDLARVAFIQRCNGARARLRIDANQGFSRADACSFASRLDPEDIELLEQPCNADDWDANEAVARVTSVPLMLDESIYDEADIDRAARIGASFVKLKLMKFISLDRLEAGLSRIRELGMEPVLGNGVASDIGCWMEVCIARRSIRNAGEMNGFLRQSRPIVKSAMTVRSGAVALGPGGTPQLDEAALCDVTTETACFRS